MKEVQMATKILRMEKNKLHENKTNRSDKKTKLQRILEWRDGFCRKGEFERERVDVKRDRETEEGGVNVQGWFPMNSNGCGANANADWGVRTEWAAASVIIPCQNCPNILKYYWKNSTGKCSTKMQYISDLLTYFALYVD